MIEVFDKNIGLGDLVLPVFSYKINIENYKARLGIVVGEDEIFTLKRIGNTYYYTIVECESCMKLDLTPELDKIKKDLQLQYNKRAYDRMKASQEMEELGIGTIFCKSSDKEDWNNAYVYIGHMTSSVEVKYPKAQSFYNRFHTDMCFENKYLFIPYATVLGAVLGKLVTTKEDKLNNLGKDMDMTLVYKRLVEKNYIPTLYIAKEKPIKIGKVLGSVNLLNVEYNGTKVKNGISYIISTKFSDESENL